MDEKSSGVVLRTRSLTETSLIVHWLTPDLGRLATVAKGARRAQSPFRGKLDLFYQADFSFARSRRSDLHTLREVVLRDARPALRADFDRFEAAARAVCLLERATESDTPVPEFHALFLAFLDHLAHHAVSPSHRLAFEYRILEVSGLQADPAVIPVSPGSRQLFSQLGNADWDFLGRLRISSAQQREIGHWLENQLAEHLGVRSPSRPGQTPRS